jgi:general secretion pathway protein C
MLSRLTVLGSRIAEGWRASAEYPLPIANRCAAAATTGAAALLCCYELVKGFVRIRSADAAAQLPATTAHVPLHQRGGDGLEGLADTHLFGVAAAVHVPAATEAGMNAPETDLDLILTGVLLADGVVSAVIIGTPNGEEKSYRIGDPLESDSATTLHSVHSDRVVIDRAGRLETVRFSQADPQPLAAFVPALPYDTLEATATTEAEPDTGPPAIDSVLRVLPVTGGEHPGFRLEAAQDEADLPALGVQPGDVVTEFNGESIAQPGALERFYESLDRRSLTHVTVQRDGAERRIFIDTTSLLAAP